MQWLVTTQASPAPYDAEGLDWLAGMGPGVREDVALMFADETANRAAFEQEREEMLTASPAALAEKMRPEPQPGEPVLARTGRVARAQATPP